MTNSSLDKLSLDDIIAKLYDYTINTNTYKFYHSNKQTLSLDMLGNYINNKIHGFSKKRYFTFFDYLFLVTSIMNIFDGNNITFKSDINLNKDFISYKFASSNSKSPLNNAKWNILLFIL